jgi:hypothetical protein
MANDSSTAADVPVFDRRALDDNECEATAGLLTASESSSRRVAATLSDCIHFVPYVFLKMDKRQQQVATAARP